MGYCCDVGGVHLELRPESVRVYFDEEEVMFGGGGELQSLEIEGTSLGMLVAACVKVGLTGPYDREALMPLVKQREDGALVVVPEEAGE